MLVSCATQGGGGPSAKEGKMRLSHPGGLLVGFVVAGISVDVGGAQERAGGRAPASSSSYRIVEWPAPATSAAGFPRRGISFRPRAWHRTAGHRARASSRRSPGSGIRQQRKVGPLVGRRNDQQGQGRRNSQGEFGARSISILGGVRTSRMHGVWRALGARGSAGQHLDRRCDSTCRVQDERGWQRDHATRDKGHSGASTSTFNLPTDIAFAANGVSTSPMATAAPVW